MKVLANQNLDFKNCDLQVLINLRDSQELHLLLRLFAFKNCFKKFFFFDCLKKNVGLFLCLNIARFFS